MILRNNKIVNIILVFLAVIAICINIFMEERNAIAIFCIALMGILAISKEGYNH